MRAALTIAAKDLKERLRDRSAIILAVTFIGVFTEEIHKVHRVKCAMGGAAAMILAGQIMGFYSPEGAVEAIDWNVVFLLGGMMTIVAIMIPTGGFQQLAYWTADFSKGRLFLLLAIDRKQIAATSDQVRAFNSKNPGSTPM